MYRDKYKVHLIDTPGFDDTQRKDIDVLKEISGVSMDLIKILDHFGLDGRCAPKSSLLALIVRAVLPPQKDVLMSTNNSGLVKHTPTTSNSAASFTCIVSLM